MYLLHDIRYCPVAAVLLPLVSGGHRRQKHSLAHSSVCRTTEHTQSAIVVQKIFYQSFYSMQSSSSKIGTYITHNWVGVTKHLWKTSSTEAIEVPCCSWDWSCGVFLVIVSSCREEEASRRGQGDDDRMSVINRKGMSTATRSSGSNWKDTDKHRW